jgi:hypothetical protein
MDHEDRMRKHEEDMEALRKLSARIDVLEEKVKKLLKEKE